MYISRIQMHFVQHAYGFIISTGHFRTQHAQIILIRQIILIWQFFSETP